MVTRFSEYGIANTAANLTTARETFFGDNWSGSSIYAVQPVIADWLCNIATSANELESLDAALRALCEYVPPLSAAKRDLNEIAARRLSLAPTGDRSDNQIEPTIALALRGIANVCDF